MRNTLFLSLLAAVSAFGSRLDGELPSCSDFAVSIATKDDLDFYSKCPELDFVTVNHNFTGPFKMPTLKSVGRFSSGYLGPKLPHSDRVDDAVTSISLPDLEEVNSGWLLFGWLNNLTSISLPKLHTVRDLAVAGNPELRKLTLPELTDAPLGISIDGPFDEINLPKLKDVGFLIVKSTGDLDCRALGKNLSSLVFHPREYDSGTGFTCWTWDENNRYNSSDPDSSSSSSDDNKDDDDGGDGDNEESKDQPKPAESASIRVEYLTALFGLVVLAAFNEFLM